MTNPQAAVEPWAAVDAAQAAQAAEHHGGCDDTCQLTEHVPADWAPAAGWRQRQVLLVVRKYATFNPGWYPSA